MEEKKQESKGLTVAVIILSILVIALGGYICYDKVISNNSEKQTESNKNNYLEEKDTNKEENNKNENLEEKEEKEEDTTKEESNKNNSLEEKKKNSTKVDTNIRDNSKKLDFDFDELSRTLHSSVQKDNITTFVSKCVEKNTDANEPPATEQINTAVSNGTIDTIINKLKTANYIDKDITYSWVGCPPKSITYHVSVNSTDKSEVNSQRVFSLNYANVEDMLLVGYNNKGYAFHFNSSKEISSFIESLK